MISSRLFQIEEAGGASADNSLLVLYILYIMGKFNSVSVLNRPFYRYGGHVELIRFKEYYGMPREHEHISSVFLSAFRDIFS